MRKKVSEVTISGSATACGQTVDNVKQVPVVPHKAVAEVSKIGNL